MVDAQISSIPLCCNAVASADACCSPVSVRSGPGTSVLITAMSPDSPCRTKSSTIDPSSAPATADPMDSRAAESNPTARLTHQMLPPNAATS
jgi:hypothetical protein